MYLEFCFQWRGHIEPGAITLLILLCPPHIPKLITIHPLLISSLCFIPDLRMLPLPNQVPKTGYTSVNLNAASFLRPHNQSMSKSYDFISLGYLTALVSLSLSPYIRPLASYTWKIVVVSQLVSPCTRSIPCYFSV